MPALLIGVAIVVIVWRAAKLVVNLEIALIGVVITVRSSATSPELSAAKLASSSMTADFQVKHIYLFHTCNYNGFRKHSAYRRWYHSTWRVELNVDFVVVASRSHNNHCHLPVSWWRTLLMFGGLMFRGLTCRPLWLVAVFFLSSSYFDLNAYISHLILVSYIV